MAGSRVTAAAQVRALAKAISVAFAASALTDEEKSPGRIEITDLPWSAPPLITNENLGDARLQDYFDVPMEIEAGQLQAFWVKTLDDMWYRPSSLMKKGVIANCGWAMARMRTGQRAFRFTQPAGWPGSIDDLAGVMFSLEVAHAAATSLPLKDFVSDATNYYAVLPDGRRIGVIDDGIGCISPWGPAHGMIPDLLTMPRGETDYTCQFDQLASLRSVLHTHRNRFPHNFEALDQALQALRLLSFGGYCPELLSSMRAAPIDMVAQRERERVLREAIDVVKADISDRAKLTSLRDMLVPTVTPVSSFKKHIFSSDQYPFTLARGKLDSILAWLEQQYQQVPAALRKLT